MFNLYEYQLSNSCGQSSYDTGNNGFDPFLLKLNSEIPIGYYQSYYHNAVSCSDWKYDHSS
jgi:hypothetical protein